MPGEPATVVAFAESAEAIRLIDALGELVDADTAEFALVGGLAVAARLTTFHRATQDLDALTGIDRADFSASVLAGIGSAASEAGHLEVDGVRIDIIDVDAAVSFDAIAGLDEPLDRLFNASHLFAYRDHGPVTIVCGASSATVPVASARALLCTKLHAYLNPGRDHAKHPSDALDIYRLGTDLVADVGRPLADDSLAPAMLEVVRWALTEVQAKSNEFTRRLARIGTTASPDQIAALIDLLLEDLAR